MPRVILLVRRNRNFSRIDNEHLDALIRRKELWNELFRIPYNEFRQKLSDIASDNYENLQVDKIYHYVEDFFNDRDAVKPDDWVIPIDDDDWLCNDIGQTIKELAPTKNLIVWLCNVATVYNMAPPTWKTIGTIAANIFPKTGYGQELIYSCCYALRNELVTEKNLLCHMTVSKLEEPTREYLSHAGLESCYLFMPCSQTYLGSLFKDVDELKTGIEQVQLLDESKLAHKPELVSKLKRLKELFAQL